MSYTKDVENDIEIDEISIDTEEFSSDEEKDDLDDQDEKVEVELVDELNEEGDEDNDDNDDNSVDTHQSIEQDKINSNNLNRNDVGGIKFDNDGYSDDDDDNDDDDYDDDENYLQKFDASVKDNMISNFHPEMIEHNETEIELLSTVVRNSSGVIIDQLHKSVPFITKYEKARIIGERTRQLNSGAVAFVAVDPEVIDGYLIALDEFKQKKIPFIIKRPLPSGKCEYWRISDLDIL